MELNIVPWADYWTKLRTDVAGNSADDVFWVNNSYFGAYADNGNLVNITETLGDAASAAWEPSVVKQFTRDGSLWGIPQLYDAGIAVYYNEELLAKAGVQPATLDTLVWSPTTPADDTYLEVAKQLTLDKAGKNAADPAFDGTPVQYGTSIANDLQGILLPFIGSNGGTYQDGDTFTFSDPKTVQTFEYLQNAITVAHVGPSAADTNTNGDFARDAFLQGKVAMFQSGIYNLKNVSEGASFKWGVASIPSGPAGKVSVTNGVVVAGNSASKHQDEVTEFLTWLGSAEGNGYLGSTGVSIPGVTAAQDSFNEYWAAKNVNIAPFFDVIADGQTIAAPQGANFAAGYAAYSPIFQEIFAGSITPKEGLSAAEKAANAAIAE